MTARASRTRLGAAALAGAGVLFILYPAFRPWRDEATVDGAIAAMSSGAWLASHLFAMIGFILVPLGLAALRGAVRHTRAESLAFVAAVTSWIGAGLTLPFYGAETFGLNAIAAMAAQDPGIPVLELVDAVRFGALASATFLLGLVALAAGAVLAAAAVWRSGVLPRYSGMPFALGFVLFLPQFFAPPAVRIAHGVLVAAGAIWIAAVLWKAAPAATR